MSDNIAQIIHNSQANKNLLFTCHACSLTFPTSDIQRYHMKSDWHRYNLKRKIEGFAPISSEEFQSKIEMFKKNTEDTVDYGYDDEEKAKGGKKSRASTDLETSDAADFEDSSSDEEEKVTEEEERDEEVGAFEAGVDENVGTFNVKKLKGLHLDVDNGDILSDVVSTEYYKTTDFGGNTTESGFTSRDLTTDDAEVSSATEDEAEDANTEELTLNDCVFCYQTSPDSERNIRHMFTKHGFYIPDRSFLKDLSGLLSFIDYIINCEEHCLVCEYQGKGIKHHLDKKRHCKMIYETPKQKHLFKDYYDYSLAEESRNKSSNETPNQVKTIKFAVDDDVKDDVSANIPKQKNPEIDENKLLRQQRVLAAIDTYKKNDKMYPGVSAKDSEAIIKHMQKMEIRFQYKQTNKSAIKRSNFQKHFRDPLLQ